MPWVESETFQALPYRPTFRLRPTSEPARNDGCGWRCKQFVDDRGDFYERHRDGEWERWYRVEEKLGEGEKLLYRYRPERKPVTYDDALDRIDDLDFLCEAFAGWLSDARERGIFGPNALTGIHSTLDKLLGVLEDLLREVQILRPPETGFKA